MGLIDFILNLAGVLVWLSWRSLRFDPLVKTTPATLVGTLRRAEPRRMKGWQSLAGLAALLVLRALLYRQIGPEADWTPRLNLFFVAPPFSSHRFSHMMPWWSSTGAARSQIPYRRWFASTSARLPAGLGPCNCCCLCF